MKITLEFEDLEDAQIYLDAYKYFSVTTQIKEHLRNKLKYDDTLTDEEYDIIENINNELHNILNENNLSI